jgi:hypothetical protein
MVAISLSRLLFNRFSGDIFFDTNPSSTPNYFSGATLSAII